MDSQIAPSIVKWFLELGIIDDQVKNHLVLNAYDVHKSIKDVQFNPRPGEKEAVGICRDILLVRSI